MHSVLAELIIGYMLPGKPVAMMMYVSPLLSTPALSWHNARFKASSFTSNISNKNMMHYLCALRRPGGIWRWLKQWSSSPIWNWDIIWRFPQERCLHVRYYTVSPLTLQLVKCLFPDHRQRYCRDSPARSYGMVSYSLPPYPAIVLNLDTGCSVIFRRRFVCLWYVRLLIEISGTYVFKCKRAC